MPLYGPPIQIERGHSLDRLQTPFFDAVAATAEDAFIHNPVSALGRIAGLQAERMGSVGAAIPAEELNERFGDLGLNFDRPERAGAVAVLVRRKQEEIARRNRLARASGDLGTVATQFLTGLAVSMADPINIASAFVPVVRASRMAIWTKRFGATRARLARGAVEGAAGAALIEPLILGAAAFDQSDYGWLDSLLNVTFGTVLGGGLHSGFGKLSDYLNRVDPDVREGALRAAVGQTAEGKPVDVAPILRTDPRYQGGEAAHDPMDPRFIPELNDPVRPPPAREFDRGPALGEGRAETYVNYSRISAADMRFIESVVEELKGTEGGHRVFVDNPFGPGQEVIGVKGTTPEWFQRVNEDATRNRQERRRALNRARKKGTAEDVKPGDFGPETILTRDKVETAFRKLKERKPLGREEVETAEILFDVARAMREERIRHIVDLREARADQSRAELDAFAAREMRDAEGNIDIGDPDDLVAVRQAHEVEAESRKINEDVRPDEEAVDEELEFLSDEIAAIRAQGALTDEELAADGLRVQRASDVASARAREAFETAEDLSGTLEPGVQTPRGTFIDKKGSTFRFREKSLDFAGREGVVQSSEARKLINAGEWRRLPPQEAREPSTRGFVNTRGKGQLYHGTNADLKAPSSTHFSELNYYGQGFYATDAIDVAEGYTRRGGRGPGAKNVYEVRETHAGLKFYDMEQPLQSTLRGRLFETSDLFENAILNLEENGRVPNLREVYDEVRGLSGEEGIPAHEVQGMFESVATILQKQGFDGLTHAGGLRTGVKRHTVKIYFDPESDVSIEKVDLDQFREEPKAQEIPPESGENTLVADDLDEATVKAHGDAAEAAARCLSLRS